MILPPNTLRSRSRLRATGRRTTRFAMSAAVTVLLAACGGGRAAPPEAGEPVMLPPSLAARNVMVLPVQRTDGVRGQLDGELTFALEAREGGVGWIHIDEMREAIGRSPSMRVPLDALPVDVFLAAEVRRIGDPLYGILRRAAALVDAEVALIPVMVRARPETPERPAAVEIRGALVDVRSGRVMWFGVEEGAPGTGDDPAAVASAMEALARRLVPGR